MFYFFLFLIFIFIILFFLIIQFFLKPNQVEDLNNKVIFITGCDSGIGLETAILCHNLGFVIVAGCLNLNSKGALELNALNNIHVVELNITCVSSLENTVYKVKQLLLENENLVFYCLINNAGLCIYGEYDWLTLDQIDKLIDVNFKGTIKTIKIFLPLLIKNKSRIITIGSVNSFYPLPGLSVYNGTKSALISFHHSLLIELKKFDIQVCLFHPGDYSKNTNIMNNQTNYFGEMYANFDEEKKINYPNFEKSVELARINVGALQVKNYENKLKNDLKNLILDKDPPFQIMSMNFIQKFLFDLFFILPIKTQASIFTKIQNYVIKK